MENMVKGVCVDYTYDGLGIIKIPILKFIIEPFVK